MKLSISNLSWDYENNDLIFTLLKTLGIVNIEGVLTKIDTWDSLTEDKIKSYSNLLKSYNIKIESIQSLFFNVGCKDISDTDIIINHFKRIIDYSKLLSVKVLVFGSPSLRKRVNGWEKYLIEIFSSVDLMLKDTNITLVIEPNSKIYGGEYFITVHEIVEFIKENGFDNIKTMIDTHNILLEGLNPINEFITYYDYINHIHISEYKLGPIIDTEFHVEFSKEIKKMNYDKIITYEIIKHDNMFNSIKLFSTIYN